MAPDLTLSPATTPTVDPTIDEAPFDESDHERMAHIVLEGFRRKRGGYVPAGTNVVEGMVTGTPVEALCGKVWVPGRDPKKYPLCPTCKEIAQGMGWKIPI